ncbi:helix-turn-helix domain-containing protein [Halovivax gelatinilyticus]|uniref:helix-turn-helix domain-containing protein n=1 Tax=Halovivax gelatinilyticus TaxID=2961597 RepID=UPI0020CA5374|nr:helix-turn-helix domain-containing protein [Halovivax gelatinilyticus]
MNAVRLAIRHTPETIHPIHDLVCRTPEIDRELLLYISVEDGRETAINYVDGDETVYREALASDVEIDEYEVYPADDGGCYTYIRHDLDPSNRALADALGRDRIAVVYPIEYRSDRRMILSLVMTSEDFREVSEAIPDAIEMDVLSVGSIPQLTGPPLTETQREAMKTAWELGYYAVPREASLADVAAELGCAASTASDLLRRGQATMVDAEFGTGGR